MRERNEIVMRIPLESILSMYENFLPFDATLTRAKIDQDTWSLDLTINSKEYGPVARGCPAPYVNPVPRK